MCLMSAICPGFESYASYGCGFGCACVGVGVGVCMCACVYVSVCVRACMHA